MSTVNFSVPEDIKTAFNLTFEGQKKSAVIADLMREAVKPWSVRKANSATRMLINAFWRIGNLPPASQRPSCAPLVKKAAREPGGGCQCCHQVVSQGLVG